MSILVFLGCVPEEEPEDCKICTRYTYVPGREPQEWLIQNETELEEQQGYDDQGRYFYVVCSPDFVLD